MDLDPEGQKVPRRQGWVATILTLLQSIMNLGSMLREPFDIMRSPWLTVSCGSHVFDRVNGVIQFVVFVFSEKLLKAAFSPADIVEHVLELVLQDLGVSEANVWVFEAADDVGGGEHGNGEGWISSDTLEEATEQPEITQNVVYR